MLQVYRVCYDRNYNTGAFGLKEVLVASIFVLPGTLLPMAGRVPGLLFRLDHAEFPFGIFRHAVR